MRIPVVLSALLLAVAAVGCSHHGSAVPPMTGLPSMSLPVGPIPGGGKVSLPTDPFIGNPVALNQGRQLFVWYNCAGCHGGHGGGGMGPSLRDQTWLFGSDDAHIFASIAQGRGNGMPAWGTKIPENQIWMLVAYIKSMRTPEEPDPPIVPPPPRIRTVKKAPR